MGLLIIRSSNRLSKAAVLSLLKESVGKISLCTSPCSPCLRGASFSKAISTRRHGDHGAYTEKFDFPDRLLKEACELIVFSAPGVNAWAREKSLSPAC